MVYCGGRGYGGLLLRFVPDSETKEVFEMTQEEKKLQLFLQQKELLDTFLRTHAISQAQYDTSLRGLREKMGIKEEKI